MEHIIFFIMLVFLASSAEAYETPIEQQDKIYRLQEENKQLKNDLDRQSQSLQQEMKQLRDQQQEIIQQNKQESVRRQIQQWEQEKDSKKNSEEYEAQEKYNSLLQRNEQASRNSHIILDDAYFSTTMNNFLRYGFTVNQSQRILEQFKGLLYRTSEQAEAGDAVAQVKLADVYYEGNGVKQDRAVAKEWYLKAAKQGNAQAVALLKLRYKE